MKKIVALVLCSFAHFGYSAEAKQSRWAKNPHLLTSMDHKSCNIQRLGIDQYSRVVNKSIQITVLQEFALISDDNPQAIPFYNLEDVESVVTNLSSDYELSMYKKDLLTHKVNKLMPHSGYPDNIFSKFNKLTWYIPKEFDTPTEVATYAEKLMTAKHALENFESWKQFGLAKRDDAKTPAYQSSYSMSTEMIHLIDKNPSEERFNENKPLLEEYLNLCAQELLHNANSSIKRFKGDTKTQAEATLKKLRHAFELFTPDEKIEHDEKMATLRQEQEAKAAALKLAHEKYQGEFQAATKEINSLAQQLKDAYETQTKDDESTHKKVELIIKLLVTYDALNNIKYQQLRAIPETLSEQQKGGIRDQLNALEQEAYDWLPKEQIAECFKRHRSDTRPNELAQAFLGKKVYEILLSLLFVKIEQDDIQKLGKTLTPNKDERSERNVAYILSNDVTLAVELCMKIIESYNQIYVIKSKEVADLNFQDMISLANAYYLLDHNIQQGTTRFNYSTAPRFIQHREDLKINSQGEPLAYVSEFAGILTSYKNHKDQWYTQICEIMQTYIAHAYKNNNFAAIQEFFAYIKPHATYKISSEIVTFYDFNRSIFIKTLALPALFIHIRNDKLEITKEQRSAIYNNLNLYCPFDTFYFFRENSTEKNQSHQAVIDLLKKWDRTIQAAIKKHPDSQSWKRMQSKMLPDAATVFTLWQAKNQNLHRGIIVSEKPVPLFDWPQEQLTKWQTSHTKTTVQQTPQPIEESKKTNGTTPQMRQESAAITSQPAPSSSAAPQEFTPPITQAVVPTEPSSPALTPAADTTAAPTTDEPADAPAEAKTL